MQFYLTLRDKEKHQERRKRNLRVPSTATKQKFPDDVIHCYQEQNAGMYSDTPVLFIRTYFIAVINNIEFLLCEFVISKGTLGRLGNAFTSMRTRVANGTSFMG
ncbi:hypothetical protein T03_15284 [Trichinella britovi]|uniref:Uncharacterized protein n=1 Tax=Trichinella britovi TaxID=45882 RepID=A0A0V1CF66_TRIBR|nr:hypothetical protein T03_15284 [Trichinella britovi]